MSTEQTPVIDKPPPPAAAPPGGHEPRFWSPRRAPATVVAVLVLVTAGAFLYDIAAVRAHHPAMHWRRELARQLAARPLDDIWVLVGAGIAAALGLWLLVLAVTPGLRDLLPMRRTQPDVRAGLRRDAAALLLRDRALEISGVRRVRVRLHRSRAHVLAVSHFRELDEVRGDLEAALTDAIHAMGLARPPALTLHVIRPGRKG
ncbi:DUF6286 domain-containing protein [Streptomyces sp. NPDC001833]|uniref:DUF6286 domain-containing protein n=1 Tax=Streptomyces sp. NPDC001833 TaxID=3154658 RepID=UPI0033275525